jgi:signal transduction histidine kinase
LQADSNHVVFVIQDHGPGIAPLDLPDLFNRVKRVTTRDGKTVKDSGLGLSIVRSIAERHQGKVWAESQLGKGSTFYLEIPLRQLRKA